MKTMLTRTITSAIVIATLASIICAQTLNADEKKIVEFIDKNNTSAVALLEKTVNMGSPTEDLAGVKNVGMVFGKEFESVGMSIKWIDMPAEMKRAGHLVAETKGTKGKRVFLLGHIDTVLRGERFRVEGTKAYGTGIGDMMGGNVIILQALKALQSTGSLKDRQVIVMLTGDEESTGEPESISRGPMRDLAKRSDLALSFEAAVLNTATVGRRGWSSWTLEVEAKTGHSGQIFKPGMGDGAIFEASRILNEFREKLSKEKYLTFNPSIIVGGTTASTADVSGNATGKLNVVPAKVIVNGDLRFISNEQRAAARKTMSEIVAKNLSGTTAKITFKDGNPAMAPVEGNYALLKQLDQVSRDLGFGEMTALDPGERGAGDIGYISDLLPSLDGIGIGGTEKSHAKGEAAALDTLPMLTKRAALLIYRLTR